MRFTILRMISSNSLSAFSNSNAVGSNAVGAVARPSAVRQVRTLTDQGQAGASVQPSKTGPAPSDVAPTRVMPRGSLLDLSV